MQESEKQPVSQSDFKNELKSMRLEFKEAIVDLNKGIQGQIQGIQGQIQGLQEQIQILQDKMEPLAHLNSTIFKNMLGMVFVLGGALFWLIDRDLEKIQLSISQYNEQNQSRLVRLEEINLTPTNQILLTKVNEFLDAYHNSEKKQRDGKNKTPKKRTTTGTRK